MKYQNIYSLFRDRVEKYGPVSGNSSDVFFVRRDDAWKGISWAEFEDQTIQFACALSAFSLTTSASVSILMGNVPEWPICDIGTIIAGGIGVGLYPTSSAEQCRYIIDHSDSEFVIVDTAAQLNKVLSIRAELPKLKKIIAVNGHWEPSDTVVISFEEFLRVGELERPRLEARLRDRAERSSPDETAITVYTSGTTGPPKGACLSHRYVINSVESLRATIPIFDTDVCFSYLPFCHVAERISGLYNRLYAGTPAHFVDDLAKLGKYMMEVRPTVFASLPRFFEKIHARAMADAGALTERERARFQNALNVGRQVVRFTQARQPIPQPLEEAYRNEALPVLTCVKDYFGGRLRLATSGGAPLPLEVAEFFAAAGIPILQAYGLTENICVAFNRADDYKFGTVGPAMPGCEIRIADDGEILIRSEMMFSGYYKDPVHTSEMFKEEWLLTGDLGELDAEGFLRITGRKKEIIVTSTGKNIAPALIENLIKEDHLISHAMVLGEGKSYLISLITLNRNELESFMYPYGKSFESFTDLVRDPQVGERIMEILSAVNRRVSSTEAIRRFAILDRDFEVERDEVTPTQKLKREVVTSTFRSLIESIYEGREGINVD
jgi:long-chain acyl-CoA synthetase